MGVSIKMKDNSGGAKRATKPSRMGVSGKKVERMGDYKMSEIKKARPVRSGTEKQERFASIKAKKDMAASQGQRVVNALNDRNNKRNSGTPSTPPKKGKNDPRYMRGN